MKKNKKKNRCRTVFCREGVYYLVSIFVVFIAAVLRQVNPMLLFASFLICPLFLAWWMGRQTLRQLTIKRKCSKRIHAGDTFVVQIELTNARKKYSSWSVVVEDQIETHISNLGQNQPVQQPAVYFEYLKPGDEARKNYVGHLPHRGQYHMGQMMVSTRFPCGFFRSWIQIGEPAELLVLPRIGKLASSWIARQHEANENQHRRRYRPSRVSGEFLGIRHWQEGDSKRWVHWRKSAQLNQLVVKQFEQHQNRDTAILVDLLQRKEDDPGAADQSRGNVELAVSFAATLAVEVIRRGGCNLLFGSYALEYEIYHAPATAQLLEQILDRLAVLAPSPHDCLVDMLLDAVGTTEPNADLVLVTDRPVRLNDMNRFGAIKDDPRLRVLAQRLRIVDVTSKDFSQIFEV